MEIMLEAQDFIMNTGVEQKIIGHAPRAIYDAVVKKLHMLEDMMSFYREKSETTRLNRQAGKEAVKLSSEMMFVLEQAQTVASLSQNAFHILLAPLVQLWRNAGARNQMPSQDEIHRVLTLCGSDNLVLDKATGTAYLKQEGAMIDLGAIGKGFAADICCDLYKELGASSAFVNLGGNVKTLGTRPDGKPWMVGLQHPDKARGNSYGAILCTDQSVVTSGAYERYQVIDGRKYHHIISGQTGHPSESDLKSVTVIADHSIQADALSTAAFVLGLKKGADLIYNTSCTGAVFFTAANEIYLTKGMKPFFRLAEQVKCYEI